MTSGFQLSTDLMRVTQRDDADGRIPDTRSGLAWLPVRPGGDGCSRGNDGSDRVRIRLLAVGESLATTSGNNGLMDIAAQHQPGVTDLPVNP